MSLNYFYKDKKFAPLLWTQFFGALNDNVYKNALVVLVTFKNTELWGLNTSVLVALASGIFILPFFIFSPLAGQLSDKIEKSKIIRLTKWLELFIMCVAGAGFYFNSISTLMVVLFFMGTQSAFFGPTKYSIIPDLTEEAKLTTANAYIEMSTFVAILLGTIVGGLAAAHKHNEGVITICVLIFALLGLITAYKTPPVPIADPHLKLQYNPILQIIDFMKLPNFNRMVFCSVLGISWFWFLGAGVLSLLPVLTKNLLQSSEAVVTLFLGLFTIGIAFGALICERLSHDKINLLLVPIGAFGMTIFSSDLAWALSLWTPFSLAEGDLMNISSFLNRPYSYRLMLDLFLFSAMGGLYTVPLYTLTQERVERSIRSRIVAANNIYNALFMVISSILLIGMYAIKMTIPQILVFYSVLNILIILAICVNAPEFIGSLKKIKKNS